MRGITILSVIAILVAMTVWAGIIYAALHFISKYW